MGVRVMRVDGGCTPLKDALVDLWHVDASGAYSGYPGQPGGQDTSGQTFLRGTQVADDEGVAMFETIYPGWYPGRTVHIHFKVYYRNNTYATSQFYFPDDFTDKVYRRTPYSDRPNRTTRNVNDSVLRGDPAERNLLATLTEDGDGYSGVITIGVTV
jgi:protocatechuate 3,4-dioxygenase beta subunit